MRNFQDTFETCKRSFIIAFSICMTVPLTNLIFRLRFVTVPHFSLKIFNKLKTSLEARFLLICVKTESL